MKANAFKTYWPLILVILYLLGGTWLLSRIRQIPTLDSMMLDFMGLFFVVFAFFKLLDLKGFAHAYREYDLPTKVWPWWGYLYPFLELVLGILYLSRIYLWETSLAVVILLGVSIIGVIRTVLDKNRIPCACLGTGFNLPMSQVTIIEDGVMIAMALYYVLIG